MFNQLLICHTETRSNPKAIRREIDVWKQLRHPHVLEFFGACTLSNPPFIVCALMEHGDAASYLREYPDADRRKLVRSNRYARDLVR